jgi:hypothetical protein
MKSRGELLEIEAVRRAVEARLDYERQASAQRARDGKAFKETVSKCSKVLRGLKKGK